jgi:hypothetical protein
MFRKIGRLIPVLEKYECRDFTKIFTDTYKYMNNELSQSNIKYPEIHITKINDKKIPYNDQWETKDSYCKNINNK